MCNHPQNVQRRCSDNKPRMRLVNRININKNINPVLEPKYQTEEKIKKLIFKELHYVNQRRRKIVFLIFFTSQ